MSRVAMRISRWIAVASVLIASILAGAQQFESDPDPDLQRHCTDLAVLRDRHGKVVWFNHEKMKEMATKKVAPEMTGLARNARIEGAVIVNMCVGPDGAPQEVWLISGHPLLVASAIHAAAQWRFRPMKVKGKPIGFAGTLRLTFSTSKGNGY
jgi:TonB family protein